MVQWVPGNTRHDCRAGAPPADQAPAPRAFRDGVGMALRLGAAAAGMMLAVPASAEVDKAVQQALALESANRMGEAFALLSPLVDTRAGDPDFDYAFGIAAVETGHRAEAIMALQRVLAVQPGNAQARAELARVYALNGDVDTAKREFDTVVDDPSLPDPVRQRFNRIVRDLGRAQRAGGTDVSGFAEATVGYDSNINTATGLTSITLPIFAGLGPATLSGGATRIGDGFAGVDGGVSVASGVSRQTRLFASVLGSHRNSFDSGRFDQTTATATAGAGHTLANRDVVSLSGQYQQLWLGGDRYRRLYGAIGQYTKRLSGGRALSLGAQYFGLEYQTDPLRGADRYAVSVNYAGRTATFGVSGGHEQTRAALVDNLSNIFADARIAMEKALGRRIAVVASGGVDYRHHDAADPLFLKRREDVQFDAAVGLKLLLASNVYARPTVAYSHNFSTINLYAYDRVVASVGVRVEF